MECRPSTDDSLFNCIPFIITYDSIVRTFYFSFEVSYVYSHNSRKSGRSRVEEGPLDPGEADRIFRENKRLTFCQPGSLVTGRIVKSRIGRVQYPRHPHCLLMRHSYGFASFAAWNILLFSNPPVSGTSGYECQDYRLIPAPENNILSMNFPLFLFCSLVSCGNFTRIVIAKICIGFN